ncbi:RimK family protein [bacterium]|nr:RimK family protein [bacterium]
MDTLLVVTHLKDWQQEINGVQVVTARAYLTDPHFSSLKRAKVFNLCRHYKYQSYGYYVSLLAEARGHKVLPTVLTMQDLRSPSVIRIASDELTDIMRKSLKSIQSDKFTLSVYFGKNVASRHDRLAAALFKFFPAPLLRATFVRNTVWELQNLNAIPLSSVPETHRDFMLSAGESFFSKRLPEKGKLSHMRFDMAILYDPEDHTSPSDNRAIQNFQKAAQNLEIATELITKDDYGRLSEFDALFIRTTTAVNHYTYRFSRRAEAEGLVVIDDPQSILRCTNKVYLAELLAKNSVPTPLTRIMHKDNLQQVMLEIGLPAILKQPDSSSSLGVKKADTEAEFLKLANEILEISDLVIVQEFMPTEFDWRIGLLDGRPLYATKYFMAKKHWQITLHDHTTGRMRHGTWESLPVDEVPLEGIKLAVKAGNLIGKGLYGVDLKQVEKKWYIIEVNDNPSIEFHVEDEILKGELYQRIMRNFLTRIEAKKEGREH